MYRTFRNPEDKIDDKIIIKGEDYNHIKNYCQKRVYLMTEKKGLIK